MARNTPDAGISRRTFNRTLLGAGIAAATQPFAWADDSTAEAFDYIVVGAGAGGGPVAARLAAAGYKVALLDAGLDPMGATANSIDARTGIIYQIPALAGVAAEFPLISWDFYVKHYQDAHQQAKDPKNVPGKGIIYPRGSALGGSTAHNAMLFVYPHDQDWDDIADTTGDSSWRARNMRQYFERLERCDYCAPNAPGHGFAGYMSNNLFDRQVFELYPELRDLAESHRTLPSSFFAGNTNLDINHPLVAKGDSGAFNTPMHVAQQRRVSIREHLIDTQTAHPDKLFLITGALATRILMHGQRAAGIEFVQGAGLPNLYEADKLYDPSVQGARHSIYARREVILSAGVFNTPQLLKLSGIGPARELAAHGIDVVAHLPGVGANLQDRYEITVNVDLNTQIELYTRCLGLAPGDPCLTAWFTGMWQGQLRAPFFGPYANNAAYAARVAKSKPSRALPDLYIIGQATNFHGFVPGFSQMELGKTWTWLVLKAHTNNTAGTVKLRSRNPREMPEINFHYFGEGNDHSGDDLRAVVEGVKLARSYNHDPQAGQYVARETFPGNQVQTDGEIADYVKNEAWGHHASCTAKIGSDDDRMAVLDSRFRVRGVKRLRVVDACAFPRVPGFFPVASIFMIGEKAADAILHDARRDDDD